MVTQKDILARLQAGESADAIAQELVDALNAANVEYTKEQVAATQKQAKVEYVKQFAALVKDYVMEFHSDSCIAEMVQDQEIDPMDIVETLDASFAQIDAELRKLKEMETMLHGVLNKITPVKQDVVDTACGTAPDSITAFLKANGLA